MNGLPYYKAYPRDFIEGTIGMDFDTKAAYRLVLDLIYMQGGNLPDDARYISGLLGCSVKKWNTLRKALVEAGKIDVRGEFIGNYRADKELESLGKSQEKQRKNRSNPNKIKEIPSPRPNHTEPEPDTEEANASSAPAPADEELARAERLTTLRRKIVAAYDPDMPPDTGHCAVWIGQGYDPGICAGVVVASVERGRKPRTLRYFDSAIQEAHERKAPRLAPAKPITPPDLSKLPQSRWKRLLDDWFRDPKSWPDLYGPRPGTPGCMCPQEIIDLENERRGKVAA